MSKIAIVYHSKHGSTKQYAEWIAEELGADLYNEPETKAKELSDYEIIVYGGGIYSGGIKGIDFLKKNIRRGFAGKKVIAFAVGISVAFEENREQCIDINFSKKKIKGIECFFLPGAFDPTEIKGLDKKIIDFTMKLAEGGNTNGFGATLIKYMKEGCNLIDRNAIKPLIERIKEIEAE